MASIANITANGASSSVSWPGGFAVLTTTGTFDGAYYIPQYSVDNGTTWLNVFPSNPVTVFDATGDTKTVNIPAGLYRVWVYDKGGSTDITVNAEPTGIGTFPFGIVAAGIHDWAGGAATTDSISVDGLLATDVVICSLNARAATETLALAVNDAANDQIDLTLSANGTDTTTKIAYLVLRTTA